MATAAEIQAATFRAQEAKRTGAKVTRNARLVGNAARRETVRRAFEPLGYVNGDDAPEVD